MLVLCRVVAVAGVAFMPAAAASAVPPPLPPLTGFPVVVKQTARCSAYAPSDWTITSNDQGSAVDLQSADRSMYAGWSVTTIDRTLQRTYGPLYGDPETSLRALVGAVVSKNVGDSSAPSFTGPGEPFLDYFTLRRVAAAHAQGVIFYHLYPGTSPQLYTESVYFALADASVSRARRAIPPGVAVSIRCATQLVPVRPPEVASARGGAIGLGRPGCGGEGTLRAYNSQLGTQFAHTPSGANYLFDVGDWSELGPDGAGYYKTLGDRLTKLQNGRSDDSC